MPRCTSITVLVERSRQSGADADAAPLHAAALGIQIKAEGAGFEPAEGFPSPVFKTGAINHSTTPPEILLP